CYAVLVLGCFIGDMFVIVACALNVFAAAGEPTLDFLEPAVHVLNRMNVRMALRYPAGAQILAAPAAVIGQRDRTRQHRSVEPGYAHRAAELEHVNAELQLLDAATEVVQQYPQHAVTDVTHVTGQELIRQPDTGSSGLQLLPHKVDIGATGVWRIREGHLLPFHQFLHGARFEAYERRSVAVGLDRLAS